VILLASTTVSFSTTPPRPTKRFFGFGQQLTYFNQKGNVVPVIVQEHGIGRGLPIVTQLVDLLYDDAGGNRCITEAPVPQYITSQLRSLFLENS
jgi:sulfoquinovosidase